jgi:L-fucose mutarotase/ribose pyranase (RbsD/FucU family)
MYCITCLTGEHPAWKARDGGPIIIVLADQHFPANIPSNGPGECFRILRIENGSIGKLTDELLRMIPGGPLPSGSIIMLG